MSGGVAGLFAAMCIGCSDGTTKHNPGSDQMTLRPIEKVLKEHTAGWMSMPGVVGCGIGERRGKPCINILVVKRTKDLADRIPGEVEGYAVDVKETGRIRALDTD